MSIKDLIKDNTVNFDFYREGIFYYTVEHDGTTYRFPVPLSDIGDAVLMNQDKAIYFMRYIRKAINDNELQTIIKK